MVQVGGLLLGPLSYLNFAVRQARKANLLSIFVRVLAKLLMYCLFVFLLFSNAVPVTSSVLSHSAVALTSRPRSVAAYLSKPWADENIQGRRKRTEQVSIQAKTHRGEYNRISNTDAVGRRKGSKPKIYGGVKSSNGDLRTGRTKQNDRKRGQLGDLCSPITLCDVGLECEEILNICVKSDLFGK